MINSENGRPLRILVIDDREQASFVNSFSTHVTIEQITSWKQAQGILAKEGVINGADVLLVDVSMIDDHEIKNAVTKDASVPILPAGPLIALPFIGTRAIMSCKVYSAHMQNADLHKHPYFLLAMGLIAARTEDVPLGGALLSRHLCPEASSNLLDKVIFELTKTFHADTESVFAPALADYRDRLEEMVHRKVVTVCNRAEATAELERLQKSVNVKGGKNIAIPDSLKLAIVGQNWSDCISMKSLFADTLMSSSYATGEWTSEVKTWVQGLAETSFERALNVIRKQDYSEDACPDNKIVRPKATDVIRALYGKHLHRRDLTEILRLVVLFANAFALENPDAESGEVTKESVFNRFGTGTDVNIYLGLFGERRTKRRTGKPRRSKTPFDKIEQLSTGKDERERCFLSAKSHVTRSDHDAIQRYRAAEEWAEWQSPPYTVIAEAKRR